MVCSPGGTGGGCENFDGSDGDYFDPDVPAAGSGHYYVVRARNACGAVSSP